ncbi:MAG: glycosyltransferase, partial [Alphaproteobacteria bacterium]|nr:glycosyltransferase [Alphaproteobacteria bacterium]
LWLTSAQFPNKEKDLPKKLLALCKKGLTISWYSHDIKSYTKLVPTYKKFSGSVIVTADDDVLYPDNWLKLLLDSYAKYPFDINCHRCHQITFEHRNKIEKYNNWSLLYSVPSASFNNFLTGVGGVLYPPFCLYKDILNEQKFMKLAPNADDIWFWTMAVLNGVKCRVIKNCISHIKSSNASQDFALCKINTQNECLNDKQLKNVLSEYPKILNRLKYITPKKWLIHKIKKYFNLHIHHGKLTLLKLFGFNFISKEKNNAIKVSIIVPVYNVEKFLPQCLDSIVNQTLKDIEIICINDGSSDNSFKILQKYAEKDERIKIITQKNKGLAAARNVGIKKAIGEYIGFVDSDDWVSKNYFENLYLSACTRNFDIARACTKLFSVNGKFKKNSKLNEIILSAYKHKRALKNFDNNIVVWDAIYKNSFIKNNNIFFVDGLVHEDIPFTTKACFYANRVAAVIDSYYCYRVGVKKSLSSLTYKNLLEMKRANDIALDFIKSVKVHRQTEYIKKTINKIIWRYGYCFKALCDYREFTTDKQILYVYDIKQRLQKVNHRKAKEIKKMSFEQYRNAFC